ncbi:hypothetical protein, partial [Cohaesibacter celericrescens]|uniref:hypothetical protein n=1 Tax=Cohaesibacter celericrescens TaxID=2067669 RepID=UPI00356AC268
GTIMVRSRRYITTALKSEQAKKDEQQNLTKRSCVLLFSSCDTLLKMPKTKAWQLKRLCRQQKAAPSGPPVNGGL